MRIRKIMQMLEGWRENVRRLPHGVTGVPFRRIALKFFRT
jgi:hypothetical protein